MKKKPAGFQAKGDVRLIGGNLKRSKLEVLNKEGLRPTPDRVRETLFNWLGQELFGCFCVDAFAGTGALGLEAASRGACDVLLIEKDKQLALHLEKNWARLKPGVPNTHLTVVCADALSHLKQLAQTSKKARLIFLDPPYALAPNLYDQALALALTCLADDGLIYLESSQAFSDAVLQSKGFNLAVHRFLKAGMVHAHLLQRI